MIETVTRRDLPDAFDATYDAQGVHSVTRNEFHEAGPDSTRWVAHNVFEFTGVMRLVGLVLRRSFVKQSYSFMEDFKRFAEASA